MSIEVNTKVKRPSREVVEGFRSLLAEYHSIAPGVSDCMNRLNAMSSDIQPLFPGIRVVGVALTVKTITSDLAPVIKALELIQKGDIIVVDTHNSKDTAFWGEIVCMEAERKGAVGIILDSAVRDVVELREMKFPVLCQGIAPNVASFIGFGYINVPIQCGGAVVNPGDIVIVDDNGVVVVPQDEAEEVLQKTRKFLENEVKVINRVNAGESLGQILGLDKLEAATIDHTKLYDKPEH
jgi:4-hydroxy-4-methyl-2-oxoglutarate aldolase